MSKLGFLQTLFEYEFKNSNVFLTCSKYRGSPCLDAAVQVL